MRSNNLFQYMYYIFPGLILQNNFYQKIRRISEVKEFFYKKFIK